MSENLARISDGDPACRREQDRRRVLLAGKIVKANGEVLKCAIRDINEQGAQIRMAVSQTIPSAFYLIELTSGVAHRAQLAWRNDDLAGLIFWDRIELNDVRANLVFRLRKIWLESEQK